MFLDTLRLNNFRSFEDEQICFGKDLTILVGENNGGKSNTIDALRLITTPLSGRREIYCESSDIRFGGAEPKFEVQATFSDLSVRRPLECCTWPHPERSAYWSSRCRRARDHGWLSTSKRRTPKFPRSSCLEDSAAEMPNPTL